MTAECLTEEASNYKASLEPPDLGMGLVHPPIPLLFQPSLSDVWNIDPPTGVSQGWTSCTSLSELLFTLKPRLSYRI